MKALRAYVSLVFLAAFVTASIATVAAIGLIGGHLILALAKALAG